jgi:hypothetical protein
MEADMNRNRSIYRIMGALLAADVALLVLSGVPAFEQADGGWKAVVGSVAWGGFMVVAAALMALSAAALVRRRGEAGGEPRARLADPGRRTALWGAAALIGAMLADLAETVLDPASTGEGAKLYQAAVERHGLMVLCGYLLIASAVLVFPGVLLLARSVQARGRRVAKAAVGLSFLGAVGHTALGTAYLAFAAMPGRGADEAQVVAMLERIMGSASLAPLAVGFIAFPLALVTLFAALVRARVAPRWVLVPVAAAPVAAIAAPGGGVAGTTTALVLLLLSAAVVTTRIFRGPPTGEPSRGRSEAHPVPALS